MRRFTALIKALVPFPAESRDEFSKIITTLELMPGEWIPDDLPSGTSIFVEEGFLLLTCCNDHQWKCKNVYREGTCAITHSDGAAEMKDGSYRVKAAERSRIYYLRPEDADRMIKILPGYGMAASLLRQRSFSKNRERATLFHHPAPDRIILVDKYFRYLLRTPLEDLVQFLGLEREVDKKVLDAIQKARLSPINQMVERHN